MKSSGKVVKSKINSMPAEPTKKSMRVNSSLVSTSVKQRPIGNIPIRKSILSTNAPTMPIGNVSVRKNVLPTNASSRQINQLSKDKKDSLNKMNVERKEVVVDVLQKTNEASASNKSQLDSFPVKSDYENSDDSWYDSEESLESFSDADDISAELSLANRRKRNLDYPDKYQYIEKLNEIDHVNDSIAHKYIERSRDSEALSKNERIKERILDPKDFWWVGDTPEPISSIVVTSTPLQLHNGALPPQSAGQGILNVIEGKQPKWSQLTHAAQTIWSGMKPAVQSNAVSFDSDLYKKHERMRSAQKTAIQLYKPTNHSEEKMLNDEESRLSELEAKFEALQQRVNRFQEKDNHSENSSCIALVSSTGVGSEALGSFMSPEREYSEKPYRPEFTKTQGLKTRGGIVSGYKEEKEDILAQWRARRRMELLRQDTRNSHMTATIRHMSADGSGFREPAETCNDTSTMKTHRAITAHHIRNLPNVTVFKDAEIQTDIEGDGTSTQTVKQRQKELTPSSPHNLQPRLRSKSCRGDRMSTNQQKRRCHCCCGSERRRSSKDGLNKKSSSTEHVVERHSADEYNHTPVKLDGGASNSNEYNMDVNKTLVSNVTGPVRNGHDSSIIKDERTFSQYCNNKSKHMNDISLKEMSSKNDELSNNEDSYGKVGRSSTRNNNNSSTNGSQTSFKEKQISINEISSKSHNKSAREYSPRHSSHSPRRHVLYDNDDEGSLTIVTSRSFMNAPSDSYISADLESSDNYKPNAKACCDINTGPSQASNNLQLHNVIGEVVNERLFASCTSPSAANITCTSVDDITLLSHSHKPTDSQHTHDSSVFMIDLNEISDGDEFKDDAILQELRQRRTEYIRKLCDLDAQYQI